MSDFISKKVSAFQGLLLGIPPADWLIAAIVFTVVWAALWIVRDSVPDTLVYGITPAMHRAGYLLLFVFSGR